MTKRRKHKERSQELATLTKLAKDEFFQAKLEVATGLWFGTGRREWPDEISTVSDRLSDYLAETVFRLFIDHPDEVLSAIAALTRTPKEVEVQRRARRERFRREEERWRSRSDRRKADQGPRRGRRS